ncbi:uncharacterized protein M6B38_209570 [Iris pallida]|uniref:Uncharacterized protein n=1 Tax=Iris pallida TaxID=29817 RepID=A0AAX6E4I0_IRIPA|nr:uncharacterized protein M6B38_209570 [Iris pallida]
MMNAAREKRAKIRAPNPEIPMALRVEKAMEGIYICCFGRDPIEEEDVRLLNIMLSAVFPSVDESDIDRIVTTMAKQVADGERATSYPEPKALSKEAVQRQMRIFSFFNRIAITQADIHLLIGFYQFTLFSKLLFCTRFFLSLKHKQGWSRKSW